MDGTFVVELPDDILRHHSFYAGGMSLGGDAGGRQILVPAKSKIMRVSGVDGEASAEVVFESEENEVSYDSKPIADAARTILKNTPVGTLSKARFYGHAAFAGLNDIVDVTVELGQEKKGSFVLRLSDDLAERNGLVSLEAEGGGHLMRFTSAEELSKAFADLALVDTFSGKLDVSLSWSRLATDGARAGAKQAIGRQAYEGGWQGGPGPRPAQGLGKLARHSGPESKAARRSSWKSRPR